MIKIKKKPYYYMTFDKLEPKNGNMRDLNVISPFKKRTRNLDFPESWCIFYKH